jgi:hypothetical protein
LNQLASAKWAVRENSSQAEGPELRLATFLNRKVASEYKDHNGGRTRKVTSYLYYQKTLEGNRLAFFGRSTSKPIRGGIWKRILR